MDNELIFNNKKFLSSKRAGELAGYTNDYVARLCRQKKVLGRMVGRAWYVEEESFLEFLTGNNVKKEKRSYELSKERKKEYGSGSIAKQKKEVKQNVEHNVEPIPSVVFVRRNIFQKVGVFVGIVLLVVGTYAVYSPNAQKAGQQLTDSFKTQVNLASVADSITSFFEYIWKLTTGALRSLAVKDSTESQISDTISQDFSEDEEQFALLDKERDGVVVVPSAGLDENEIRKQEIEEAFSDEIEIIPDEDGRSGIIKPIFKNPEDQEYLYVLVPIDEKDTEN